MGKTVDEGWEDVGQVLTAEGVTYQANVKRSAGRDGTFLWEVWRYNAQLPMGSLIRGDSARPRQEAVRQARAYIQEAARAPYFSWLPLTRERTPLPLRESLHSK
jgi:hypothetical protein